MSENFDIEGTFKGEPGYYLYLDFPAASRLEAMVRGRHMVERNNPGHAVEKLKVTPSTKRIDDERKEAASKAALASQSLVFGAGQ